MKIEIPFGQKLVEATLPEGTDLLRMAEPEAVANLAEEIAGTLARPIGCEPLVVIAADRAAQARGRPRACIVVSDNTRPVPYKGADGILMPLVRTIANAGFA